MRVAVEQLRSTATSILDHLGLPSDEAALVAQSLIRAEMRGIPTHGVNFLPMIAQRIRSGLLEVPTKLAVISEEGATTHIDGGNGIGQVAATLATRRAIEKARTYGIGVSLVKNTNHIGLLASYTLMAAEAGMIGFCSCNSAPSMAPWGGAEPFFGTNPFSIAAPGEGGFSVVLDMSTSVVARGKIRRALRMKQPIPTGWALDADGEPTMDPEAAMRGTLLPVGGPKGYGMAFFVDLVTGLLSGSKFSRDVRTFHQPLGPTGVGVIALAIDVSRFMPLDSFRALMAEHMKSIHESSKAASASRIYLPGEIEAEKERRSLVEGVEIDPEVFEGLQRLQKELGLESSGLSTTTESRGTSIEGKAAK